MATGIAEAGARTHLGSTMRADRRKPGATVLAEDCGGTIIMAARLTGHSGVLLPRGATRQDEGLVAAGSVQPVSSMLAG